MSGPFWNKLIIAQNLLQNLLQTKKFNQSSHAIRSQVMVVGTPVYTKLPMVLLRQKRKDVKLQKVFFMQRKTVCTGLQFSMMAGSKSLYFHGTLVPVTKSFHHFKCCALQSTAKSVLSSSSSLDESLLDSVSIPTGLLFTLAVRAAFDSTSCFFNISTRCLYSLCTNEKMVTIKTFSLCSECGPFFFYPM